MASGRVLAQRNLQAAVEALESVTATVTGTVDTGLEQPVTDAQLRASALAITTASALEITTQEALDFLNGNFRSGGCEQPISSGGNGYVSLVNPAGSGKNILLKEFTLATTLNADIRFVLDGEINAPTTHTVFNPNRLAEALPTVSEIRSGTALAVAGTTLSAIYRQAANVQQTHPFSLIMGPGMTVIAWASTAALETMDLYASAVWCEVDA